jgi:hypothetical protein
MGFLFQTTSPSFLKPHHSWVFGKVSRPFANSMMRLSRGKELEPKSSLKEITFPTLFLFMLDSILVAALGKRMGRSTVETTKHQIAVHTSTQRLASVF